jgi:hypothetical protein
LTYAKDIGELADDEVAYFEKKTNISDKKNFVLQDTRSFDTIEKRAELIKAAKEHKYIPYGRFIGGVEFEYTYIDEKREAAVFLDYCGQKTDNTREARILIPIPTTSLETTVPPVADSGAAPAQSTVPARGTRQYNNTILIANAIKGTIGLKSPQVAELTGLSAATVRKNPAWKAYNQPTGKPKHGSKKDGTADAAHWDD